MLNLLTAMLLSLLSVFVAQDTSNLTGDWSLSLIGDHVMRTGLVLEQTGTKLSGTLLLMGKEALVDGEFSDGAFTLAVKADMHDNEGHSVTMKLIGKQQDDGTLAGEMDGPHGKISWTAERMKKRK